MGKKISTNNDGGFNVNATGKSAVGWK